MSILLEDYRKSHPTFFKRCDFIRNKLDTDGLYSEQIGNHPFKSSVDIAMEIVLKEEGLRLFDLSKSNAYRILTERFEKKGLQPTNNPKSSDVPDKKFYENLPDYDANPLLYNNPPLDPEIISKAEEVLNKYHRSHPVFYRNFKNKQDDLFKKIGYYESIDPHYKRSHFEIAIELVLSEKGLTPSDLSKNDIGEILTEKFEKPDPNDPFSGPYTEEQSSTDGKEKKPRKIVTTRYPKSKKKKEDEKKKEKVSTMDKSSDLSKEDLGSLLIHNEATTRKLLNKYTGNELKLLLALHLFEHEDEWVDPTLKELTVICNMSEPTVSSNLSKLEEDGIISIPETKKGKRTKYYLNNIDKPLNP